MTTQTQDHRDPVIATRVPKAIALQLEARARAEDRTLSAEVRRLILHSLEGDPR